MRNEPLVHRKLTLSVRCTVAPRWRVLPRRPCEGRCRVCIPFYILNNETICYSNLFRWCIVRIRFDSVYSYIIIIIIIQNRSFFRWKDYLSERVLPIIAAAVPQRLGLLLVGTTTTTVMVTTGANNDNNSREFSPSRGIQTATIDRRTSFRILLFIISDDDVALSEFFPFFFHFFLASKFP